MISIFGFTPTNPREANNLGIATIFQEILVADNATVVDNLFVGNDGLFRKRLSRRAAAELAREMMNRLTGAEVDPERLVGELPISVKQWIVIGRAFLKRPKVLILDESSAALDLDATARLHEQIRSMRAHGSAIVVVTHRIAELISISDRATVLRDGRVCGELDKADITEQNLLSLMTPQTRVSRASQVGNVNTVASGLEAVLFADSLRIRSGAPQFSFSVSPREIVGITGLEGHGQNRFLRILAGLEPAAAGIPSAADEEDRLTPVHGLHDADRLRIAYVSGDRKREGIFPNLSIYENLVIGICRSHLGPAGWIKKSEIAGTYDAEVKRFSIKAGNRGDKITSLSGGNQQKVLIARALAQSPRILILNDPARGVDLGTKRELYEELRRFVSNGGAVVYLSSEIEEFLGFADRVAVFHNDSIFRILTGEEVSEHAMLAAMFGQPDMMTFDFDAPAAPR